MFKKLLQIILISTALFSYDIHLGKPSDTIEQVLEPKLNTPLVRDDSKELVIDKSTGLMWQDNIDTKTIRKNRKDAKQYCRSLVFAGYDDWYLPRVKELRSIVDEKKYNPAIRNGFKNIISSHYWTSSPNLSDIVIAINIDFKNGQTYNNTRKGKAYLRCVRGNYDSLI
ncbi:Lcl C-terminal domain-containing protein [Sulfurimonas sp.]